MTKISLATNDTPPAEITTVAGNPAATPVPHKRKKALRKNALSVLMLRGISMACSIVMVPLMIDYMDTYRYGVWITISSVIAWINFFDIGLGNGLRNKFGEAIALNNIPLAKSYVSTAYFLLCIFSTILMALFLVSFIFINWPGIFNVNPSLSHELSLAVLFAFGFQILSFSLKLITSMLNATHKSGLANSYSAVSNVLALLIIYFIFDKTNGNNLVKVAFIYSALPVILLLLITFYYFGYNFKNVKPSIKYVEKKYVKDIMGLGIKFFVLQICALVLITSTPFIVAHALGQEEVTRYNTMFKLYNIPYMVFYLLLTPFWSAFTEAYTRNDMPWIKKQLRQLFKLWALVNLGLLLILIFNKYLFHLWVGNRVRIDTSTGIYFVIYFVIYSALLPVNHFINGIGKVRIQLYIYIVIAIVNVPLSFLLAKPLGINGPIIANTVCLLPLAIGLAIQTRKILKGKAVGVWNK